MGRGRLDADLVLEGGGVKGIALVGAIEVLEEHGYRFHRIAGTSAGAIVAALVAAGMKGADMVKVMRQVDYGRFRDRSLLDRLGPPGKVASLVFERGIYEGRYLTTWLGEQLAAQGVRTFGDVKLRDEGADPGLLPDHRYRLVVMASDVSNGWLVRLPWNYDRYGCEADDVRIVDAVRASMSIPFFYEPVRLRDHTTGQDVCLVDGGMLSNFPIEVFDRHDRRPRWPTFGIKLSARRDAALGCEYKTGGLLDLTRALVGTMTSFHDRLHIDDPSVISRTIFVDTMKVKAIDFDLTQDMAEQLYQNGRTAAETFLETWDFGKYLADRGWQEPS
jgi:NTE family protein